MTTPGGPGSAGARGRVAVVVPTWNRRDDVLRCLRSLAAVRYPDLVTVVVDNGSADGTAQAVRDAYPDCVVLRQPVNLGFAGGNNAGIRWALAHGADWVLLVNNDAEATPDLVAGLVGVAAGTPRAGAVGARNLDLDEPDRLWGAWGELTYGPFVVRTAGRGARDGSRWHATRDADWVIGNGMLLGRAALETVGLLDESFFAYHEDVDWCLRARRAGFRVVYAGRAAILHRGGGSSAPGHARRFPQAYFLGRNGVLLVRRHGRPAERLRFAALCGAAWAARLARAAALRALPGARTRGEALWAAEVEFARGARDALLGRPVSFERLGLPDCAMAAAPGPAAAPGAAGGPP